MRRSGLFWAVVLILVGALLLLGNLGILRFNFWQMLWPALLILLGLWVLIGASGGWGQVKTERISVPLEGSEAARVVIDHGVGPARLTGPAGPGALMSGEFGGGVRTEAWREGATQHLKLKMSGDTFPMFFPWGAWDKVFWEFGLSKDVPLTLVVKGGAGILDLDMRELRIRELKIDGGVGTSTLWMPASAGQTRVDIEAGVGTLTIHVPEGVAARISSSQGLGTITVNQRRFPSVGERVYQSPDYESAANRVEMHIEGGVGTVTVN